MSIATRLCLVISAAAAGMSSSAYAAIQTYEISGGWADKSECLKTADGVVDALKSRVNVVSSNCEQNGVVIKLQVTYVADKAIDTVSTLKKGWRWPEHEGGYLSKAECVAKISDELAMFKTYTGLEPFITQCFNEKAGEILPGRDGYNWNLLIEALGPAPAGSFYPTEMAVSLVGTFFTPLAEIHKAVASSLEKKGMHPALVQVQASSSIINALKIRAYVQLEPELGQTVFANYSDGASCLKEAARLNQSNFAGRDLYMTAICMRGASTSSYDLHVLHFAVVLEHANRPQKIAGAYDSFALCDAQRSGVISRLEQSLGKPVSASICGMLVDPAEFRNPKFYVLVVE